MEGFGGAAEQPNAEDAKESQRAQKIPGKNYEIYSFQRLMGRRWVVILLVSTHTVVSGGAAAFTPTRKRERERWPFQALA